MQQMLSCGHQSARVDILTRYSKFFNSLRHSASKEVQVLSRFLARDIRSVTGRNLQLILDVSGLNPWTDSTAKLRDALTASEVVDVPPQDRWRLSYLGSLLSQRRSAYNLALDTEVERLSELIDSLVLN